MQLLPRQLHQQVEAEGRVRAGRLLLARPKLQLYPLRRRRRTSSPSRRSSSRSSPHAPASASLADRRAAAAAIFTDPRNGRLPRTLVNRIWQRLLGHGIVANPDEMDGEPWSPALLDWLASDFVDHGYDVKHLIATIMSSRAYQMPAVPRERRAAGARLRVRGPESGGSRRAVRRRHRRDHRRVERLRPCRPATPGGAATAANGASASSSADARARPADSRSGDVDPRDEATTLQALELVNGEC